MEIHPIKTTEAVRNAYLRYLKTIKPFQDEELRQEFIRALEFPDLLVKGPLVQIALPYLKDLSIEALVEEGVLAPGFARLCSEALPYDRVLYSHQVRAIRKAVNGHNIVVSTGTGSGKDRSLSHSDPEPPVAGGRKWHVGPARRARHVAVSHECVGQ